MITAFVDMLGLAMVIPLLPFYATKLGASASIVGILIAAFSIAQLASAPLWGRFSDRYGRRPALLAGLMISAVAYVIFAYATTLWLLLLCRVVQGVGGGTIGVVQAYVADASDPKDRAKSLGWLSAATSLGAVVGPAIGSALIHCGPASARHCVSDLLRARQHLRRHLSPRVARGDRGQRRARCRPSDERGCRLERDRPAQGASAAADLDLRDRDRRVLRHCADAPAHSRPPASHHRGERRLFRDVSGRDGCRCARGNPWSHDRMAGRSQADPTGAGAARIGAGARRRRALVPHASDRSDADAAWHRLRLPMRDGDAVPGSARSRTGGSTWASSTPSGEYPGSSSRWRLVSPWTTWGSAFRSSWPGSSCWPPCL